MIRSRTRIEIDVVVQVGELPVEPGRVGQHTQFVFIKNRLPADELQHDLTPRTIGEAPVNRRGPRVDIDYADAADQLLHLPDIAAGAQHQRHELQIGDARSLQCRIVVFISAVIGKIEQSGRKPGLVQSLGHELLLLDRQADIAVLRREDHAVAPARNERLLAITPGNDHILAAKVAAAPFDRACHDAGAVAGRQRDARTGGYGFGPESDGG